MIVLDFELFDVFFFYHLIRGPCEKRNNVYKFLSRFPRIH